MWPNRTIWILRQWRRIPLLLLIVGTMVAFKRVRRWALAKAAAETGRAPESYRKTRDQLMEPLLSVAALWFVACAALVAFGLIIHSHNPGRPAVLQGYAVCCTLAALAPLVVLVIRARRLGGRLPPCPRCKRPTTITPRCPQCRMVLD